MIRTKDTQDRLYLSRGDEEIFIDNCNIPPHHIEGIRFIFRQFKQKKLGVIINDPLSFGRNIQIVLFLKAVSSLLKKPVLILCQEGAEHDWVQRFHTWTDLSDEILINVTNPAIKKQIVINTMINLPLFSRRDWSIVIVDTDKNNPAKEILKLPFNTDFKIWNTPISMKDNLDRFTEIYSWLNPGDTFDKYYFIPNADSAVDVIDKAILLDSFMEDIVLRREDFQNPFEKYQRDVAMPPPKITTTPVVSKKNKDATGTKIKRSKTRTDTPETNKSVANTTKAPVETVTKPGGSSRTYYDSTEDFSIDNYRQKQKQFDIDYGKFKNKSQSNPFEIHSLNSQSDLKLYFDTQPSSWADEEKLEEMDTLSYEASTFGRNINEFTKDIDHKNDILIDAQDVNDDANMNLEKLGKEISDISPTEEKEKTNFIFTKNNVSAVFVDSDNAKQDELKTSGSDTKNNSKDPSVKSLKRSNIDEKMKECEETLTKKFKGSVLDRLF